MVISRTIVPQMMRPVEAKLAREVAAQGLQRPVGVGVDGALIESVKRRRARGDRPLCPPWKVQ
jgi:hypothetical protein